MPLAAKKIIAVLLISICFVETGSNCVGEEHKKVARYLPADIAVLATLQSPQSAFDTLLSIANVDFSQLNEASELLLLTDPSDGSVRNAQPMNLAQLLKAASIHWVVFDSRDQIGEFAILIDCGSEEIQLNHDTGTLLIRFLSQLFENQMLGQQKASAALLEALTRWESTLSLKTADKWIVVGSSDQVTRQLSTRLDDEAELDSSLANDRGFQNSTLCMLEGACLDCYISARNAKQLALSLGYEKQNLWEKKFRDEIPWIALSIRLSSDQEEFTIDRKTIIAATMPLSGHNCFWKFYRPIEEFPPLTPSADIVIGKHVLLDQWNQLAKETFDDVYGADTYSTYADNPVSAFRTGISRPQLGNLSFSIMDLDNPPNTRLFKINADAPRDTISSYLDTYYTALEENKRLGGYYQAKYRKTKIHGIEAWWIDDSQATSSEPQSSETDTIESHEAEDTDPQELNRQETKASATGEGAILLDDWVVIGNHQGLDELMDWGPPSAIRTDETTDIESTIQRTSRRLGLDKSPHEFEIRYADAVRSDIEFTVQNFLYYAFPVGWDISPEASQEAKHNSEVRARLSRPQLLGFYLIDTLNGFSHNELLYSRVESITDANRMVIGESLYITPSKAEE